jgi:hypothetical protein
VTEFLNPHALDVVSTPVAPGPSTLRSTLRSSSFSSETAVVAFKEYVSVRELIKFLAHD